MVDTKKSKKSGSQTTANITQFSFVGKVARMGESRLYIAIPAKTFDDKEYVDSLYGKLVKVTVDVVT